MRSRLPALTALAVFVLTCPDGRAQRPPLTPEQLIEEARVIVVGKVVSHETHDEEYGNGTKTRWVDLRVAVESVPKNEASAAPGLSVGGGGPPGRPAPAANSPPVLKPGETIDIRCWTLVRPPSDGNVVSTGHKSIPGDGGRAKFFLHGTSGGPWSALIPNGVELLDKTPPLTFATEAPLPPEAVEPTGTAKEEKPDNSLQFAAVITVVVGVVVIAYLWVRWSNRPRGAAANPA
jgi:hypothetical protein